MISMIAQHLQPFGYFYYFYILSKIFCHQRSQQHLFPIKVGKFCRQDSALVGFRPHFYCTCRNSSFCALATIPIKPFWPFLFVHAQKQDYLYLQYKICCLYSCPQRRWFSVKILLKFRRLNNTTVDCWQYFYRKCAETTISELLLQFWQRH